MKNGRRLRLPAVAALITTVLVTSCSSENAPVAPSPTPPTARYRVTFQSTWSQATHPEDFPATAHFSRLVGGTHSDATAFWGEGTLATAGIKDMAERGRTTPLDQEIQSAIGPWHRSVRFHRRRRSRLAGFCGARVRHQPGVPLVTLVSMIAQALTGSSASRRCRSFRTGNGWANSRSISCPGMRAPTAAQHLHRQISSRRRRSPSRASPQPPSRQEGALSLSAPSGLRD